MERKGQPPTIARIEQILRELDETLSAMEAAHGGATQQIGAATHQVVRATAEIAQLRWVLSAGDVTPTE